MRVIEGKHMMKRLRLFLATAAAVVALVGCPPETGGVAQGSISGVVVKGPVSGAVVTAFAVDEAGRRGSEVGAAESAADGTFTVSVTGHSGPTLLCATSGNFVDEATGGIVQLGAQGLCALVDNHELGANTANAGITPWTSLHAALTGCYLGAQRESDFANASNRAQVRFDDFLAAGVPGFQFRKTGVLDPTAGPAPSLTPEAWHGLLLAGISESARQIAIESEIDVGVRVTGATLTTELIRDIDDGNCVFDGLAAGGTLLTQGDVALSANSLRGAPQGLAQSLKRFADGDRNTSGISGASLEGLTDGLSRHTSEIFGGGAEGDLDPPVVTIVEPVAGPVAGRPAITVTATDASPVTELRFIAPAELVGTGTKTCDVPTSCRLVGDLNTALFVPGAVTITAEATDEAGNTDTTSVTVVINNSIPVISVESPAADVVRSVVLIRATAADVDGIAAFNVNVPGVVFLAACSPQAGIITNCDQEPDPTIIAISWDTTQMPEGPARIAFAATDTANNNAFVEVLVDIDNVNAGSNPVVTVTSPSAGVVANETVIRAAATDTDGIASFTVAVPNIEFAPACFAAAGLTRNCDREPDPNIIDILWDTTLAAEGPTRITFTATDSASNNAFVEVQVDVDNVNANSNPTITVASPAAGIVAGERVIRATVADANGIASFTIAVPNIEFAPACFGITRNCDREPDPSIIDILWDTTLASEGSTRITFTAADRLGNSSSVEVDVDVDNLGVGTISGRLDVGASLVGATVRAFQLNDDGARGLELGSDSSVLDDGLFQIENTSSYTGPLLVVANGGSFTDVASGFDLDVNAGQELTAALERTIAGGDTRLNLNLWTTLAAHRTVVRRADSASMAAAITFNRGLFEKHIRRPGQALPILTTSSANLSDEIADSAASDGSLLALTQAGLSRLAADLCVRTNVQVGSITSFDLLDVLLTDLDDGLFDGQLDGVRLDLDAGAQEQADSYILRRDLANGIFNFAGNVALPLVTGPRNTGGIDGDSLSQPGKVLDDVALNNDGNLFPSDEPPLPFDQTPPGIDFLFLQPHNTAIFGDALAGVVTVVGSATDTQSRLSRFQLLEPLDLVDVLASSLADLQVQLTTDRPPNVEEAASACGIVLGDPPLNLPSNDKQVCLCAEAADEVDNTTRELWCFTRPPPTVSFGAPSPAGDASVTGTVVVVAAATSGFDLASFSLLDGLVDEPESPSDAANTVRVTIPTSFVDQANKPDIVVRAQAADIAGSVVASTLRFTRPAPTLVFDATAPNDGASVSGDLVVGLTATTGYDLATLAFTGDVATLPTAQRTGSQLGVTITPSFVDVVNQPNFVVAGLATDLVGRTAPASRTFTRSAPSIILTRPSPAVPNEVFSKCGGALNACPAGRQNFPVDLTGSVTSGYNLSDCSFKVKQGVATTTSGNGTRSATSCSVLLTLNEATIPDGDYSFEVTATDLVGRKTTLADSFRKDIVVDALAVTAPANNFHTNATTVAFAGTVSDISGVAKVEVVLTGANTRTLTAVITNGVWAATLAAPVVQGNTTWFVRAVDIHGNLRDTSATPRSFIADTAKPTLGTPPSQPAFLNEAVSSGFTSTGSVASNNLTFTPGSVLTTPVWPFAGTTTAPASPAPPVVSRWTTRRDLTTGSPPTVSVTVADSGPGATTDAALLSVRWGLGTTCPTQAQATNVATRSTNVFSAVITDATTTVDLAAQTGVTTLCLAFFAVDEAGNFEDQYAFLKWSSVIPPVSVDVNGSLYAQNTQVDDAAKYSLSNLDAWFHLTDPALGSGYVVEHAVLYNPHAVPIDAQLNYGGTVTVRANFLEDYAASGEELTLWWSNTAKKLTNPGDAEPCVANPLYGPSWSAIRTTGGILRLPLTTTVGTCNAAGRPLQTLDALPAKYRVTATGNPRTLPRSTDAVTTGLVSDSRIDAQLTGFTSLARTLKVSQLNANGSLAAEVTTSACSPNVATCRVVTLPPRTLFVARWFVRHTAPSTSQFLMDCSSTASDFDAQCPLYSNNLITSVGGDTSPAASAVPNLNGICVMRNFEGAAGCATIFQTNDATQDCGAANPLSACYIDKANWQAQRFSVRANAGSTLTQTYRSGAVSSAWTNLTQDHSTNETRALP